MRRNPEAMNSTKEEISLTEIREMEARLKAKNQRSFQQAPFEGKRRRRQSCEKMEEWGGMAPAADGETISLEDVRNVANKLKQRRLVWGLTQGQLGELICYKYGARLSQTTVSRFEMMDCTIATARRLYKPMKDMLELIDDLYAKNGSLPNDLLCTLIRENIGELVPAVRERKRRITYSNQQLGALDALFQQCESPTSAQLNRFAEALGLDFSEVRVWFCNRRQKRKKSGKVEGISDETTEEILARLENKATVREQLKIQDASSPEHCTLIETLDRMPKESIVINVRQE